MYLVPEAARRAKTGEDARAILLRCLALIIGAGIPMVAIYLAAGKPCSRPLRRGSHAGLRRPAVAGRGDGAAGLHLSGRAVPAGPSPLLLIWILAAGVLAEVLALAAVGDDLTGVAMALLAVQGGLRRCGALFLARPADARAAATPVVAEPTAWPSPIAPPPCSRPRAARWTAVTTYVIYDQRGHEARGALLDLLPEAWSFGGRRVLDFGWERAGPSVTFSWSGRGLWGSTSTRQHRVARRDRVPAVARPPVAEAPPLGFEPASFDLILALSVFTHLTESSILGCSSCTDCSSRGLLIATYMGRWTSEELIGEPWDEDPGRHERLAPTGAGTSEIRWSSCPISGSVHTGRAIDGCGWNR